MKKIINLIINTKTTTVLLIVFAFMMARATFIENDFGTATAKYEIYNSFIFELIMFLLALNFIGNIKRYGLLKKEKLSIFLFHISFIIILLGAFFTRYFGFEGIMDLREGQTKNYIKSNENYLQISINNGEIQKDYEKQLILSKKTKNYFSNKIDFLEKIIEVDLLEFIPNAQKNISENKENGEKIVNIIILSPFGEKQDVFIKENEIKNINNSFYISFNKNKIGDINLNLDENNLLTINSINEGIGIFDMIANKNDTLIPNETKVFEKKIYTYKNHKMVLKNFIEKGEISYNTSNDKSNSDLIIFKIKTGEENQLLEIIPNNPNNWIKINGLNLNISYSPKIIELPFEMKLNNFILERYAGSNSPKSYESDVTLIENQKEIVSTKIFMNNTLKYKGYKFFQSSYDTDLKGSILSVNYDTLGTITTYIGYLLMAIGMLLTLFSKNRFGSLFSSLSKKSNVILFLPLFLFSININSQEKKIDEITFNKNHSENFSSILVQDPQGRIKPINTLSLEVLRKIYGKEKYKNLDANQIFLSMIFAPDFWANEDIIKIKDNELVKRINPKKKSYLCFNDFFDSTFTYKILDEVNKVYQKPEKDRNELDKTIIKVDEKLNILFSVFNRSFLNIYPLKGDENRSWYNSKNIRNFKNEDSLFVSSIESYYFSELENIKYKNSDYSMVDSIIGYVKLYQTKMSDPNILPTESKIKAEIYYNKSNIFQKLYHYYTMFGILSLIIFFLMVFKERKIYTVIFNIIKYIFILLFLYHTFGLILRWYISGHAPWSNGYESMVYIAWGMGLFGICFSYKSRILIPVSLIISGITLFVSKLSLFDPQITNLVPVLNSYWLIIHVAVITISYSFFAVSTIIAFIVLLVMIFKTKHTKEKFEKIIKEFSTINEISLILGLFLLSIGTFLGGVWANESWGRYWGWDPKETWALISVIIYSILLHFRLVPQLRGLWLFNVCTIISFFSILMTYFGVNYYLSGLHSYAKGDPVPIPNFVYYSIGIIIIISTISYLRNKKIN